ncbi:hypothetical protein BKA65DRAFT_442975 [Rhexocercosporidium sp. MPI-PUGE-AT-0058]|nr:hypothetical protein BKA65DRAFT_442975 [Rhexocercosporidium sp. MPI-PUGE-AT-0058]
MKLSLSVLLLGVTAALGKKCKSEDQLVRKEWRALSIPERDSYLAAVTCLFTKPSKLLGRKTNFVPQNRYEDFVALHIWATTPGNPADPSNFFLSGPGIHFNGVFLPWHRYLLWTYEAALRDECSYSGAQPYWDWTLDTVSHGGASFASSPIFSPTHGFGGNGVDGTTPFPLDQFDFFGAPWGSCVADGPFASPPTPLRNLGYGYNLTTAHPHCVKRNFQVTTFSGVDSCLSWPGMVYPLLTTAAGDFANFTSSMGTGPGALDTRFDPNCPLGIHGGGHFGVGGEMVNTWSSTNDPLFFMHHAQLDRIWALWQSLDSRNLFAIGGPVYPNGTGGTVGLDYTVEMLDKHAFDKDAPVGDVMDPRNSNGKGILCYRYEEDGQPVPPAPVARREQEWSA